MAMVNRCRFAFPKTATEWTLSGEGHAYALLPVSSVIPVQRPPLKAANDLYRRHNRIYLHQAKLCMIIEHVSDVEIIAFTFENAKERPEGAFRYWGELGQPTPHVQFARLKLEDIKQQIDMQAGPLTTERTADGKLTFKSVDETPFHSEGNKHNRCVLGKIYSTINDRRSSSQGAIYEGRIEGHGYSHVKITSELGLNIEYATSNGTELVGAPVEFFLGVRAPLESTRSGPVHSRVKHLVIDVEYTECLT